MSRWSHATKRSLHCAVTQFCLNIFEYINTHLTLIDPEFVWFQNQLSSSLPREHLDGRELGLCLPCIPGATHRAWHIVAAQRGFDGLMNGHVAGMAKKDS